MSEQKVTEVCEACSDVLSVVLLCRWCGGKAGQSQRRSGEFPGTCLSGKPKFASFLGFQLSLFCVWHIIHTNNKVVNLMLINWQQMSRDVCKDLGGKNTFCDKKWDYDRSWRTKPFFSPSSFPPEPCSALTPQPGRCSWAASHLSEGPPETRSHCLSVNATSAPSVVMHAVDKPGDWRASLHFFYFISSWQLKTSPNNTILSEF